AALGPFDLDRYAAGFAPEIAYVDRRTLGLPPAHGEEAVFRLLGTMLEVADGVTTRVDDVLALRSDALLARWTNAGIDRAGGGPSERPFLWLGVFGADGLLTRIELFDADRDDQALARFDVLTSAPSTPSAGAAARAAGRRRRVRANAATAHCARLDAAIAARDADALAALLTDRTEIIYHPSGAVYGRDGLLRSGRPFVPAPASTSRTEPLAALGNSLALFRHAVSASGVARGSFDVGTYELDVVALVEADAQDRAVRAEVFAEDHLGQAIVRLYERHAELLPDSESRAPARPTARSAESPFDPFNIDIAGALHPEIEFLDHRLIGFEPTRGAEQLLTRLRTLETVATDVAVGIDGVLSLRANGLLVSWTQRGTAREGGGTFETTFLLLWVFGPDGLATHQEIFPSDREGEAIARFDELTGELPPTMPSRAVAQRNRRVRPNAATANDAGIAAAIAAQDGDALATLFAESLENVEHPTGAVYHREGVLRGFRSLLAARDPQYRQEPLATLCDALALCRVSWGASGLVGGKFDVGAYETDGIYFIEVDAHGRRLRTERFLVERLGDAVARLYERYAELLPEGPARTRAAATARSAAAMVGPIDVARWAPALAPALEFADHRHVSLESGQGAQAYLRSLQA